ncbi:hypothetical protein GDO81_001881 [Engystomops pustulosus]|uniref:Uncharacterized protein n=1 Tax=Engystomops pustulosus TaxID=76066 RepID=A0AAV7DGT1_ENGPU|nr:hypothetical protein GDO81_001881 [Engystomops pustulosus]
MFPPHFFHNFIGLLESQGLHSPLHYFSIRLTMQSLVPEAGGPELLGDPGANQPRWPHKGSLQRSGNPATVAAHVLLPVPGPIVNATCLGSSKEADSPIFTSMAGASTSTDAPATPKPRCDKW